MTLPDCKNDVENDDGIADTPPVPSHDEVYGLINKLTVVGGTELLRSHLSTSTCVCVVHRLQQKVAMERSTKLTQRRGTGFFC